MYYKLHANLHTLHCVIPTDEGGEDEPYMWSYFVRADGTTLRQNPANPGKFVPSLTVVAKPGGHGDLNIDGAVSGSNFHIPPALGQYETELQPIPFTFTSGTRQIQGWIPGRLVALAAVLDEDSTSDGIASSIHHAATDHIQLRINQFFGGLDFGPVITGAVSSAGTNIAQAVTNVRNAVNTFLTQQIGTFRNQMTSELTDLAVEVAISEIVAMGIGNPLTPFRVIVNALDHDDMVGVGQVSFPEDTLIQSSLNLDVTSDVRDTSKGLGSPWYILHALAYAELKFDVSDIVATSQVGAVTTRTPGTPGTFTPTRTWLCVPEGPIQYFSAFVPQSHDILVTYPFCTYRYSIEGAPLNGNRGSVSFQTQTTFQEFNELGFPFVKARNETRTATISFQIQPDPLRPQLQHLILTNTPADGTYYFTLKIEALLPSGGAILVMNQPLSFQGQHIEFAPGFIEGVKKCLEPFTSDKYSKSKRVGPKELWGPVAREQRYAEVQNLIEEHAAHFAVAPERLRQIKSIVARAFGR